MNKLILKELFADYATRIHSKLNCFTNGTPTKLYWRRRRVFRSQTNKIYKIEKLWAIWSNKMVRNKIFVYIDLLLTINAKVWDNCLAVCFFITLEINSDFPFKFNLIIPNKDIFIISILYEITISCTHFLYLIYL